MAGINAALGFFTASLLVLVARPQPTRQRTHAPIPMFESPFYCDRGFYSQAEGLCARCPPGRTNPAGVAQNHSSCLLAVSIKVRGSLVGGSAGAITIISSARSFLLEDTRQPAAGSFMVELASRGVPSGGAEAISLDVLAASSEGAAAIRRRFLEPIDGAGWEIGGRAVTGLSVLVCDTRDALLLSTDAEAWRRIWLAANGEQWVRGGADTCCDALPCSGACDGSDPAEVPQRVVCSLQESGSFAIDSINVTDRNALLPSEMDTAAFREILGDFTRARGGPFEIRDRNGVSLLPDAKAPVESTSGNGGNSANDESSRGGGVDGEGYVALATISALIFAAGVLYVYRRKAQNRQQHGETLSDEAFQPQPEKTVVTPPPPPPPPRAACIKPISSASFKGASTPEALVMG